MLAVADASAQALLIEGVLHVSQQHSKQQDQQRQELQQQLFAALALRIRNQTAAGQQPLDVAEVRWPVAVFSPFARSPGSILQNAHVSFGWCLWPLRLLLVRCSC